MSKVFILILLSALADIGQCQYSGRYDFGSASEQIDQFGQPKKPEPVVFTTTPGDLCREFMGSEGGTWASYAYRADICTRPVSCRERPSFIIKTRPGSPPEGMLCALHLREDGHEAIKFVCHRGGCMREQQ